MWQEVITYLIVFVAFFYAGYKIFFAVAEVFRKKDKTENCPKFCMKSCSGCPYAKTFEDIKTYKFKHL